MCASASHAARWRSANSASGAASDTVRVAAMFSPPRMPTITDSTSRVIAASETAGCRNRRWRVISAPSRQHAGEDRLSLESGDDARRDLAFALASPNRAHRGFERVAGVAARAVVALALALRQRQAQELQLSPVAACRGRSPSFASAETSHSSATRPSYGSSCQGTSTSSNPSSAGGLLGGDPHALDVLRHEVGGLGVTSVHAEAGIEPADRRGPRGRQ